jgi:hypothetical protein
MKFRHLIATALLAVACSSQASIVYGSNLIVNGDAEQGTTGWTGYSGRSMFQSVNYGSNWVLPTQPGPADRGAKMFTGLDRYAAGYQTLDFGMTTTSVIAFELSGWLGGWASQEDNALLYVEFLDDIGNLMDIAFIGPVMPGDRNDQTGLFYREVDGFVPIGTSKVTFSLSMERVGDGTDNDGYADNLAFVLDAPASQVPEPATSALALLSLGLMGWLRRRKS